MKGKFSSLLLVSMLVLVPCTSAHALVSSESMSVDQDAPSWSGLGSETISTLGDGLSAISDTASSVVNTVSSAVESATPEANRVPVTSGSSRGSSGGRGDVVTRSTTGFEFTPLSSFGVIDSSAIRKLFTVSTDPKTLYALVSTDTTNRSDIYVTHSAGVSWQFHGSLPAVAAPYYDSIVQDLKDPLVWYIFWYRWPDTGTGETQAMPQLRYITTDAGKTWTELPGTYYAYSPVQSPTHEIVVSAHTPGTVYIAAYTPDRVYQFFVSTDGGKTFTVQKDGTYPINYIETGTPSQSLLLATHLYGNGYPPQISHDQGKTWKTIDSLKNVSCYRGQQEQCQFTVDPRNNKHILLSVWTGYDFIMYSSVDAGNSFTLLSTTSYQSLFGSDPISSNAYGASIQSFLMRYDGRTNTDILILTLQNQSPLLSKDGGLTWTQITANLKQYESWSTISDVTTDTSVYFTTTYNTGISVLRPVAGNSIQVKATLDGRPFDSYTTKTTKINLAVNFECYLVNKATGDRTRVSGLGVKWNVPDGTYQLSCTTKTPTDYDGSVYIRNLGLANDSTQASEMGSKPFELKGNSQQTVYVDFQSLPSNRYAFTATSNGLLWFGNLDFTNSTVDDAQPNHYLTVPTVVPYYLDGVKVEAFAGGPKGSKLLGVNPHFYNVNELSNQTYNFPFTPANTSPTLFIPGVYGTDLGYPDGSGDLSKAEVVWLKACETAFTFDGGKLDLSYTDDLKPTKPDIKPLQIAQHPSCLIGVDYGYGLKQGFRQQGYLENNMYFEFPYDWRDGVSYMEVKNPDGTTTKTGTVASLAEKINSITPNSATQKLNIIAHSTGGLILKKYLQLNNSPDKSHVDKVVYLGVPQLGSARATLVATNGDTSVTLLNNDKMKTLAKNMPIVTDLSPSAAFPYNTYKQYTCTLNTNLGKLDCPTSTLKSLSFADVATRLQTKAGTAKVDEYANIEQNPTMADRSKTLHTELDGYDANPAVSSLYSLSGCKIPTISGVIEKRISIIGSNTKYASFEPELTLNGDKTVTAESYSSSKVKVENRYYSLGTEHADLPSGDTDTRNWLVNLMTGGSLPVSGVTQNLSDCALSGSLMAAPESLLLQFTALDGHTVTSDDVISNFENTTEAINTLTDTTSLITYQHYGQTNYFFLPEDSFGSTPTVSISKKTEDQLSRVQRESIVTPEVLAIDLSPDIIITRFEQDHVSGTSSFDANQFDSSTFKTLDQQQQEDPSTLTHILQLVPQLGQSAPALTPTGNTSLSHNVPVINGSTSDTEISTEGVTSETHISNSSVEQLTPTVTLQQDTSSATQQETPAPEIPSTPSSNSTPTQDSTSSIIDDLKNIFYPSPRRTFDNTQSSERSF